MERIEVDLVDLPLRILVSIDGALNDVPELAHVAGPVISLEPRHRARTEAGPIRPIEFGRHAPGEMLGEPGDGALADPQRRKRDDLERQAIKQVRSELALL